MNILLERRLIERVAEQIAPLCDGDEQLLADMMCGETPLDHIVMRLHEQIARDQEMLLGIKERQDAIAERKARIQRRVERFKEQIGTLLRAAHLTKLELPEVSYSIRDGKPTLKVVDPEAVPGEFCRIKTEPDKTLINDAFADTPDLPNWLVWSDPRDVVTARTR